MFSILASDTVCMLFTKNREYLIYHDEQETPASHHPVVDDPFISLYGEFFWNQNQSRWFKCLRRSLPRL